MASRTSAALEIRKLRKKLRQIEHLERKEGDLLDEELTKISKKTEIREHLLRLLATAEDDNESFEASTQSNMTNNSNGSMTDLQDSEVSAFNVTVVSPENEEDGFCVDVESLDVEICEETDDHGPQVVEVFGSVETPPRGNPTGLTPTKEAEIEQNNPYHVFPRESIKSGNVCGGSPPKEKTKAKKSKNTEETQPWSGWRDSVFYVSELEGHNDLITDTDTQGTTLVTASRDTTIKMWDLEGLREMRSFGGHTSSVNSVVLLSPEHSNKVCEAMRIPLTEGRLILSGSTDCHFKLWCSSTGKILRSTYTFSPVTRVAYHPVAEVFITGSDGGKLEMWDLQSGKSVQSLHAFEDSVSGVEVDGLCVYASSGDGYIKVYEIRDKCFHCIFESDNIRSTDGSALCSRGIRGMTVKNDVIYYGDDGPNVKALTWKSVRSSDGERYLCSLTDAETDRILSICCSKLSEDAFVIVSAGVQLKAWIKTSSPRYIRPGARRINSSYYPRLNKSPRHSDIESDLESSDAGSDDSIEDEPSAERKSWTAWCSIV
ncbi:uncharacterized protein LOC125664380 isoform X2 [Ostrea edulis]|uniref:uncharacterized protein LOC125664380 isoform X2 n=1 Tax=Ostrea edulis TaxID=37623 RepID=UPI0024AFD1A3|nr:uncharacterized protein LOC125664380 isoform X2 [Ostrea edulis]